MLVIVCPGQGSQAPGFLAPWLELPGVRQRAEELSESAGVDLVAHGTTSDADTIKDTAVAQPLIVGAGLLSLGPLFAARVDTQLDTASGTVGTRLGGGMPALGGAGAAAGHSVGEITAAAAGGVLSPAQAMGFVSERGRGMAAASAVTATGMSAVVGGDPQEVADALQRHGLTPANMNSAGQVVAAGTMEQLAALAAEPPTRARVIPLAVAGAFHTHYMAPAVDALQTLASTLTTSDSAVPLVSNADGQAVTDGAEVLRRLVAQVSSPVRWDLCMQTFADLGVTGLIEIPPAGTLIGLAKRSLKGVELLALKTPDDLEKAHEMIAEHGPAAAPAPSSPSDSPED